MSLLSSGIPFILGFFTYHCWTQLIKEANRGQGGEILRIVKLRKYDDLHK